MERNKIHMLDCVEGMKNIEDNSATVVIADPPYGINKDFGNESDKLPFKEYLEWCDTWISECLRILKPNGTLYIFGINENLAYIRVQLSCKVRWLTWQYDNRSRPGFKFWQRSTEGILCCWKEGNNPHFNVDLVREPYGEEYKKLAGKPRTSTKGRYNTKGIVTTYNVNPDGALPRDCIKIPALSGMAGHNETQHGKHPTQKPLKLCLRLLNASKHLENDLVVIPFSGSGSEAVACSVLQLPFIGFELNKEYIQLSEARLKAITIEESEDV